MFSCHCLRNITNICAAVYYMSYNYFSLNTSWLLMAIMSYYILQITPRVMLTIIEKYKQDLEAFVHKQLPRFHMSRSFHDRCDSSLLLLARLCPFIHTLVNYILTFFYINNFFWISILLIHPLPFKQNS